MHSKKSSKEKRREREGNNRAEHPLSLLQDQTWVRSLACSKASLLTLGCGEGKCSVYCRTPSQENRQLTLKRLELPNGFQGRHCEGGGCRVCDQLMHGSRIGWHQGEVSSIINLLVSNTVECMRLRSAIFIWLGSASYKNNLGMCVGPLSVYFRELGVW